VHLLGPSTFEQVLKSNNFFLTTVVTVPVNLEYEAWFAVIDANQTSDTEPISLHDHLLRQPWFFRLEAATRNKTLVVTTKPNLLDARTWIDANLENMIHKSIPPEVEPPPSHLLPHRLDKPVITTTSRTYADILKQQFSLEPTATTTDTAHNRPPCKRQATVLNYDSDQSDETTAVANNSSSTPNTSCDHSGKNSNSQQNVTTSTHVVDYAQELATLKSELQSLRLLITTAVEQLKSEIASTHATQPTNNMETETDQSPTITPAISDLIADLKQDIATIALEMRAKFNQQTIFTMNSHPKHPSVT